ncbi:hypothetical protein [Sulfurimonas sp.]|uniref:hypothetical protein n=1 Tax=Sulfurimonas sp. TaxID=2022749 RepID=UPI00262B17DD|nr:hypothetical protein [Sulfurimonas sp.]MCW8895575.1 hypothetical protein [Sulfurimonas sp.]MCW9066800.1 hypothetical protein [Sulfurimonas sp.]
MQVTRYLFQSPYSNQIQIGRPDTSSSTKQSGIENDSGLQKAANQSLQNAEAFKATQIQEVKPAVSSNSLLDTYA